MQQISRTSTVLVDMILGLVRPSMLPLILRRIGESSLYRSQFCTGYFAFSAEPEIQELAVLRATRVEDRVPDSPNLNLKLKPKENIMLPKARRTGHLQSV